MIHAYNEVRKELEESGIPAGSYVESKAMELARGRIIAEKLKDVVTEEEADDGPWGAAQIRPHGELRFSKGAKAEVAPL